jgi:hypothetical protein
VFGGEPPRIVVAAGEDAKGRGECDGDPCQSFPDAVSI